MKRTFTPLRIGLLLGSLLPAASADVTLVEDGRPASEIVVSSTAGPMVRTAAQELQNHLEAISGAKLAIVDQPSEGVKNQLYVGESEATKKLGFSSGDLKYDGFKIVAEKNYVIVAGKDIPHFKNTFSSFMDVPRGTVQKTWEEYTGHEWRFPPITDFRDFNKTLGFHLWDASGTLHGAYDLLKQLGMRWYMPVKELGVVVPKLPTVRIKDQSVKREPEFPVRILTDSGNGQFENEFLWYKSLGVGNAFLMPIYHSLSGPLKINPAHQPQEYYGIVNGKIDYHSPRLTNERLRAATATYLEFVDKAFPMDYFCIGQPDGWSTIDDRDAAAGWNKTAERGREGCYSDYQWDFIADVQKRLAAKHPDKKFTMFAYSGTKRIPGKLDKVPDNMTVAYCQTSQNWMLPSNDLAYRDEWLRKMSHKDQLLVWDYYLQHAERYKFPPVPIIFTQLMKKNFAGLYDHAAGYLCEVGWNSAAEREQAKIVLARPGLSHLMLYLHGVLSWDRNTDIPALLSEYYKLFYGPAEGEMREFFEFSESVWTRPESRQITAAGGFLKPADVKRYFEILGRAKAKAGDSVYGKRIDLIAAEMEPLKLVFDKLKRIGPNLQIKRGEGQNVVDGDLDKPFWRAIPHTFTPLRDLHTAETPSHAATNVSFRWAADDSALFVAVECLEPKMKNLREGCKDRDSLSIYADDNVEIHLETPNGMRPKIVVNPVGAVLDECLTENVEDLPSFYTVGDVAVKKYDNRWTVEVRVDAKTISGDRPTPYFPWGVNVCRQRLAGNTPELYMLSPSGTNFKDVNYMANIFMRK